MDMSSYDNHLDNPLNTTWYQYQTESLKKILTNIFNPGSHLIRISPPRSTNSTRLDSTRLDSKPEARSSKIPLPSGITHNVWRQIAKPYTPVGLTIPKLSSKLKSEPKPL